MTRKKKMEKIFWCLNLKWGTLRANKECKILSGSIIQFEVFERKDERRRPER